MTQFFFGFPLDYRLTITNALAYIRCGYTSYTSRFVKYFLNYCRYWTNIKKTFKRCVYVHTREMVANKEDYSLFVLE